MSLLKKYIDAPDASTLRQKPRNLNSGKERTKYTLDGLDVLVDNDDGTLTKYLNGPGIDNKLRTQTGSSVNYFLTDHLGSTNGLADGSGNLTSSASYDFFGNQTGNEGRELFDQYAKGDPIAACDEDRFANKTGANGGLGTSPCSQVCSRFRPSGIPFPLPTPPPPPAPVRCWGGARGC